MNEELVVALQRDHNHLAAGYAARHAHHGVFVALVTVQSNHQRPELSRIASVRQFELIVATDGTGYEMFHAVLFSVGRHANGQQALGAFTDFNTRGLLLRHCVDDGAVVAAAVAHQAVFAVG